MVRRNTFDIIYDNHLTEEQRNEIFRKNNGLDQTCFRRSCAENFDRLSLEFDTGAMGLTDPIPPDSRSSCSIMAGTRTERIE